MSLFTRKIILTGFIFLTAPLMRIHAEESNAWKYAGWDGGGMYPALTPDSNVEGRVYLGSDVAGVWRSEDRGDHWAFINEGLENLIVSCIAAADSDSNVLYAATRKGISRSVNAGRTWQFLKSTEKVITFEKPQSYRVLAIHPSDAKRIYAGSQSGQVFVSSDGGEQWKAAGGSMPFGEAAVITAVQLDPVTDTLFAASKLGLARLSKDEKKWQRIGFDNQLVSDLFYDARLKTLYAASGKSIHSSLDSGNAWESSAQVPSGEVIRLAISRDASGHAQWIAGTKKNWDAGVFRSADSGKSWQDIKKNIRHDEVSNPTRRWMRGFSRPNSVAVDPFNPKIFYYTDSWGVFRSDDGGASWHEIIKGAPNTSGSDLAISSNGWIYASAMDQGILVSKNGGMTYEPVLPDSKMTSGRHTWRVGLLEEDSLVVTDFPWDIRINQTVLIRAGGAKEVFTIGNSKQNTMWGQGYARALAVNPADPKEVYLGMDGDDGGGLFISQDGGRSWKRSAGQPGSLRIYNGLAVDPSAPNRIYWGSCGKNGGVYRSEDKGATWEHVFSECGCVFDLAVSPEGRVYAAGALSRGVLYASDDQGRRWKKLQEFKRGEAADALTLDPRDSQKVFVGSVGWMGNTGGAIFGSADGGQNWKDMSAGLPANAGPAAMAVHPQDHHLYVHLYAAGIYKRDLSEMKS